MDMGVPPMTKRKAPEKSKLDGIAKTTKPSATNMLGTSLCVRMWHRQYPHDLPMKFPKKKSMTSTKPEPGCDAEKTCVLSKIHV